MPVFRTHIGNIVCCLFIRKAYCCFTGRRYCTLPFGIALCKITVLDQIITCLYRRLLLGLCLFQRNIVNYDCMLRLYTCSSYRAHGNTEHSLRICIFRHLKYMTEILVLSCQLDLLRA